MHFMMRRIVSAIFGGALALAMWPAPSSADMPQRDQDVPSMAIASAALDASSCPDCPDAGLMNAIAVKAMGAAGCNLSCASSMLVPTTFALLGTSEIPGWFVAPPQSHSGRAPGVDPHPPNILS